MDACRKQNYGDCCRECCRVSILVLVDACRKPAVRFSFPDHSVVSILVLVDACRKLRSHDAIRPPRRVSILVLVDACRKPRGARQSVRPSWVSILVLVDACRKPIHIEGSVIMARFQSLFSWMPAGNAARRFAESTGSIVSILVLVDACRKPLQSTGTSAPVRGFNPCSRGCLPETRGIRRMEGGYMGFQSLFSWMPAGNSFPNNAPDSPRLVSILVLVDACRKQLEEMVGARMTLGFNPCSRGCLPETHPAIVF